MSEHAPLPRNDWTSLPLARTATTFIDGDWIESPWITSDGIRLVQTGNIGLGEFIDRPEHRKFVSDRSFRQLACKWVYPGDLLICRLADPIGRACEIPEWVGPCVTAVDCTIVRFDASVIDRRFALHVLNSEAHLAKVQDTAGGTTRQRISRGNLGAISIPLPPLSEQRRIAAILDTADEAIAKTEALIAKLRWMKAGLLHDLLTRGLDDNGQLRDPDRHPEQFKDSPLGRIPAEWRVVPVGRVFEMQLGKMLSRASKTGHRPFPYVGNRAVQWNRVDLSALETMDFTDAEREKFKLQPGDLLVCEGGEVGRTASWAGELDSCFFQKAIHRLRPIDGAVFSTFMLGFMRHATSHGYLTKYTSQTSIAHLTREKFALVALTLPPSGEQEAIVGVLDAHDARIRAEEAYRDKLKQIKKGLTHDLLTGRVRVKVEQKAAV